MGIEVQRAVMQRMILKLRQRFESHVLQRMALEKEHNLHVMVKTFILIISLEKMENP